MTTLLASRTGLRSATTCFRLSCPPVRSKPCLRNQSTMSNLVSRDSLPRILQPSMWENIIPPTVRRKTKELFTQKQKRSSNPASYFIWIYLLIGSQAIRIITVKNDQATYSRRAELQIDKLREVIQKLQAGEEVDVEKVLGTGVPEEEEAWEQALKEIENEERVWNQSKVRKREEREARAREREQEEQEKRDASPVNVSTATAGAATTTGPEAQKQPFTAPGFF